MAGPSQLVVQAAGSWPHALVLFYALIMGHAVADFPLQGRFLAMAKDRHNKLPSSEGEGFPRTLWIFALTVHSLIHGATLWLITGSVVFALAENIVHWFIDLAKCEKLTTFSQDQGLHVLCKAVFAILAFRGLVPP